MSLTGFDMANNVKLFVMEKTVSPTIYNINYQCLKHHKKFLSISLKEIFEQ